MIRMMLRALIRKALLWLYGETEEEVLREVQEQERRIRERREARRKVGLDGGVQSDGLPVNADDFEIWMRLRARDERQGERQGERQNESRGRAAGREGRREDE